MHSPSPSASLMSFAPEDYQFTIAEAPNHVTHHGSFAAGAHLTPLTPLTPLAHMSIEGQTQNVEPSIISGFHFNHAAINPSLNSIFDLNTHSNLEPTLHCLWPNCNTAHPDTPTLLAHWKALHLPPINALSKLQSPEQKHYCLWNGCHKQVNRPSDLDRHVQSLHLGQHRDCFVPGCANNGGRGFMRQDKLRAHEKKAHGFF